MLTANSMIKTLILGLVCVLAAMVAQAADAESDGNLLPSGNGVQLTPEERSSFAIKYCYHIRTVRLTRTASELLAYGEPYERSVDPMGIYALQDAMRKGRPEFLFKLKAPLTAAWSGLNLPAGTLVGFHSKIVVADASGKRANLYYIVDIVEDKVRPEASTPVLLSPPPLDDPVWKQTEAERGDYVEMVARKSASWFTGGKDKTLEDRLVKAAPMAHMCEP